MRITLRPEWRLWPLSSFFGLLDLKTGVTVALLFALLNKVAGVYGLIAVLTGAGGSFAQLSLYVYSAIALVALGWGLRAVKEEDARHTLYFAHLFFADHLFSTIWTVFFSVVWWVYTPHDGRRQANSAAQEEMMKGAAGGRHMSENDRESEAMRIWNHEKGTAATIIVISWLAKIYFALLLYSYASHLRKGSYRLLYPSRINANALVPPVYDDTPLADESEEPEDFYRVPIGNTPSGDLIAALPALVLPGRFRKSVGTAHLGRKFWGKEHNGDLDAEDVLFDESELPSSKLVTDEATELH